MLGRGAIAICAFFAVAFLFLAIDQKGGVVPRIRVDIKTTVDGKQTSSEWILPAVWRWDFRPGAGLRSVQSPFDTVYLRLPGGEALGVEYEWLGDLLLYPRDWSRVVYHLLDSLDEPMILTSYSMPAQGGRGCPIDQPIRDCKVTAQVTRLQDGLVDIGAVQAGGNLWARRGAARYEEIRQFGWTLPKQMLFAKLSATFLQTSAFRSDPLFGPLMGKLTKPAVIGIDGVMLTRFETLPGARLRGDLVYRGGNMWRADDPFVGTTDYIDRPETSYRLTLVDQADVVGFGTIRRDKRHLIAGSIEYMGKVIEYDPIDPLHDDTKEIRSLALVDPERDTVVVLLGGPSIRVIWKVNP